MRYNLIDSGVMGPKAASDREPGGLGFGCPWCSKKKVFWHALKTDENCIYYIRSFLSKSPSYSCSGSMKQTQCESFCWFLHSYTWDPKRMLSKRNLFFERLHFHVQCWSKLDQTTLLKHNCVCFWFHVKLYRTMPVNLSPWRMENLCSLRSHEHFQGN